MSEKLKNLGEGIKTTYGFVETKIREHFWCLLVILLVTFILSLTKGSDADRLSIASSALSIVLALVVVIFSLLHASDMKDLVRQAWQKVEKQSEETSKQIAGICEQMGSLSQGAKPPAPAPATGKAEQADRDYQFDPARVSWMTLIALYCISQARKTNKPISKISISSTLDRVLKEKLDINYTTQGVYSFLEGVVYGLMCFLPEGYITSTGDTIIVRQLPQNFTETVKERIDNEKVQTPKGEKVFGTLRPAIDAYFQ